MVRAWSWLCRKVNSAAAGAAQHGEKVIQCTHTASSTLGHTATTHCETAKGRPKQQAQFIFKSEFMVMSAFLKSMFNFDLGLLIVFVHLRSGDAA